MIQKKPRIVIGVDPGTVITGYGLIREEGNTLTAVDYGCIRPPRAMPLTDRYYAIFSCLKDIIERYSPDALAVETQYVDKNVQSALKLGMARGVVIIAAKSFGIPVFEYSPSRAKSAVTGNGRASKEQIQGMIQRLLNLKAPPEPEDAADALAIALCHIHNAKSLDIAATAI